MHSDKRQFVCVFSEADTIAMGSNLHCISLFPVKSCHFDKYIITLKSYCASRTQRNPTPPERS
jgi:hypothetical protein